MCGKCAEQLTAFDVTLKKQCQNKKWQLHGRILHNLSQIIGHHNKCRIWRCPSIFSVRKEAFEANKIVKSNESEPAAFISNAHLSIHHLTLHWCNSHFKDQKTLLFEQETPHHMQKLHQKQKSLLFL